MLLAVVLSMGLSVAVQAGSLTSGCERCHLVLHDVPAGSHVAEWAASPHAARRVGCVRCHNGDATADDALEAHRFVFPASVRTSPIHRTQLPATCGQCHPREATQFTTSRHGALLASNAAAAPSCSSCHGAMSARIPSPTGLEAACAACHLETPTGGSYPSDARVLMEWVTGARERLASLQLAVAREPDDVTRRQLWTAYDRATDRLRQAVGALHAFDLSAARSELMLVRADLQALDAAAARHTR